MNQRIATANGIDPGTHMIPAASCSSARAEIPPGRHASRAYPWYSGSEPSASAIASSQLAAVATVA